MSGSCAPISYARSASGRILTCAASSCSVTRLRMRAASSTSPIGRGGAFAGAGAGAGRGASVDGTPFDTYAEAYLWAESHYKYADPPTQSIYDCVQICDDLFPGPNGTLACPRSALELELIQDIFWRERAAASSARRFSPR